MASIISPPLRTWISKTTYFVHLGEDGKAWIFEHFKRDLPFLDAFKDLADAEKFCEEYNNKNQDQ
jgi:hypothetical protein